MGGCIRAGAPDAVVGNEAAEQSAAARERTDFETFRGTLPKMAGDRDVCFQFTSPTKDPYYTVARVQLTEAAR